MRKLLSFVVLALLLMPPLLMRAQDSVTITFAVNDASMGAVTPAPGTYTFAVGEEYSVTAAANDGYMLLGWTMTFGEGGEANFHSLGAPVDTLTDTAAVIEGHIAYTITAVFVTDDVCNDCFTLDLRVNHDYMGTLNLEPGIHHFDMGANFMIYAYPNDGYEFVGWYVSMGHPSTGVSQDEIMDMDVNCIGPVTVSAAMLGFVNTLVALFDGPGVGVDEADAFEFNAYGSDGRIFVKGADGREVSIYDIYGRQLNRSHSANALESYAVPATGTYLVKVAGVKAKRVVVVR